MTTHTLRISHSGTHNSSATVDAGGNYPVLMIRKELSDTEVVPANIRFNITTHTLQITLDGGVTWVNAPGLDVRTDPAYLLPARTSTAPRCDAAENMVAEISDRITAITSHASVAEGTFLELTALGALFAGETAGVSLLGALVLDVVDAIFIAGTSAVALALTSTQYGILKCILFCDISPDGTVNQDQFTRIQSDITAQMTTLAAIAVNLLLSEMGYVGLNNAGSLGSAIGSCGGCTTCSYGHKFDFVASNQGWVVASDRGVYALGAGFVGSIVGTENLAQCIVNNIFNSISINDAETIVRIDVEYDGVITGSSGDKQIILYIDGNNITHTLQSRNSVSGHVIYRWNGSISAKGFMLADQSSNSAQTCYIKSCTIWYTNPVLFSIIPPNV